MHLYHESDSCLTESDNHSSDCRHALTGLSGQWLQSKVMLLSTILVDLVARARGEDGDFLKVKYMARNPSWSNAWLEASCVTILTRCEIMRFRCTRFFLHAFWTCDNLLKPSVFEVQLLKHQMSLAVQCNNQEIFSFIAASFLCNIPYF